MNGRTTPTIEALPGLLAGSDSDTDNDSIDPSMLRLVICFKRFLILMPAWFPYGRNGRKNRVTILLNDQFKIVYTCKPHINHKYSLVIITPRIFSSKMLHFG
jgi:hypothetical protein